MMISVVVPVFNSEYSLQELYDRLTKALILLSPNFELIMVDDCSQDGSFQVMRRLRDHDMRVKIIRLAVNSGQHNATFCGLNYCRGDYIITIDDDLQFPPEEIHSLLEKTRQGYDAVFGIPQQKKHITYRNWGSFIIDKFLVLLFPNISNIKRSSFRILNKNVVSRMISQFNTPIYLAALILQNSTNPGNVVVNHVNRKYGKSNYTIAKLMKLTGNLLFYADLPFRKANWIHKDDVQSESPYIIAEKDV